MGPKSFPRGDPCDTTRAAAGLTRVFWSGDGGTFRLNGPDQGTHRFRGEFCAVHLGTSLGKRRPGCLLWLLERHSFRFPSPSS